MLFGTYLSESEMCEAPTKPAGGWVPDFFLKGMGIKRYYNTIGTAVLVPFSELKFGVDFLTHTLLGGWGFACKKASSIQVD